MRGAFSKQLYDANAFIFIHRFDGTEVFPQDSFNIVG